MARTALSLLSAAAAITSRGLLADAHQHCHWGARNPVIMPESEVGFCPTDDPDGFCCDTTEETAVQARYDTSLTGECADLRAEVSLFTGKIEHLRTDVYQILSVCVTISSEERA